MPTGSRSERRMIRNLRSGIAVQAHISFARRHHLKSPRRQQ